MNIFLRELRAHLKSLLIWSFIVVVFCYVGFSKFSAYYQNPDLLSILDSMPKAMLAAFSVTSFNMTTVTGFYGLMITYFALILGIAAAMWGSDIISKEERGKTVEFALTLPVTRARVVTAKLAAAAVCCLVLTLVTWGITLASARSYEFESEFNSLVSLSMLAFLLNQGIFLALGIFLGCAMKQYKRAGSIAVWILLATYFGSVLAGMDERMKFLRWFSPFKYFEGGSMLRDHALELPYVLLSLGIMIVLLGGAYLAYSKRDLYI